MRQVWGFGDRRIAVERLKWEWKNVPSTGRDQPSIDDRRESVFVFDLARIVSVDSSRYFPLRET